MGAQADPAPPAVVTSGVLEPISAEQLAPAPLRLMSFPVLGPVVYRDDWGECRDGCTRLHQGHDIMGQRMQPLVSPVDGVVVKLIEDTGRSGNGVEIADADGWRYNFFHINNDPLAEVSLGSPQADDEAKLRWRWPSTMQVGTVVKAGQIIGWMGDSGNAEHSVVHLHFEIRMPDGTPINPYTSLRAAEYIDRCRPAPARPLPITSPPQVVDGTVFRFPTRTGNGFFTISTDGSVLAEGDAMWVGDQNRAYVDCSTGIPLVNARGIALPTDPNATTTVPVATEPVDTEPPATDAPVTDPTVSTEPDATQAPPDPATTASPGTTPEPETTTTSTGPAVAP
jgi:peptidoglycan LD-endopeptidase LytH